MITTGCISNKKDTEQAADNISDAETQFPAEETASPSVFLPTPVPIQNSGLSGKIICVDAGHGIFKKSKKEAVAPGNDEMKAAFVSGTSGADLTEEQLNLIVALKLKTALEEMGATVVMTRETAECDLSNIDRAKLANSSNSDIMIRLHADGNNDSSICGMSMLVPSEKYITDDELISKSRTAGELVLAEAVKSTGAKSLGVCERSDLTGFNWSEVPVILLEMGFMTNPDEDKLLSDDDYQDKIVKGIVNGLEMYFA